MTKITHISEAQAIKNFDDIQRQYSTLLDDHIAELYQLGMPKTLKATISLLRQLPYMLREKAIPALGSLEALLTLLDIVNRQHTRELSKKEIISAGLDSFLSAEASRMGALSDIEACTIYADNSAYTEAMRRARAQLDILYILAGVDRTEILRAELIQRRARRLTRHELISYKRYVAAIPAIAVENAYRKFIATDLKVSIETLDNMALMPRAEALRATVAFTMKEATAEACKILESAEFIFNSVCKLLNMSVPALEAGEIQERGFDNLLGEWLRLDPIPNVVQHIEEKIERGEDCIGALSVLRVMLDLTRHTVGIPRAVLLQVGVLIRENESGPSLSEEEKHTIH